MRAVGQHEATVGRALAARVELVELEVRQVGDEVRLPDVEGGDAGAAVDRHMLALALELVRLAEALGELERVVEDEIDGCDRG